ncbi:MAG: hypothetical protein HYY18_14030 [Planctomycetes bacterium]|nr:hypothetical protein [Planctomycetota bacterium]
MSDSARFEAAPSEAVPVVWRAPDGRVRVVFPREWGGTRIKDYMRGLQDGIRVTGGAPLEETYLRG